MSSLLASRQTVKGREERLTFGNVYGESELVESLLFELEALEDDLA
jgi:hypothetical protein